MSSTDAKPDANADAKPKSLVEKFEDSLQGLPPPVRYLINGLIILFLLWLFLYWLFCILFILGFLLWLELFPE